MSQFETMQENFKTHFNYTDEEMAMVASNPKYRRMLEKAPQSIMTQFIFEVDAAHGCAQQHQRGQTIVVNGDGSLACRNSPERICIYLLQALIPITFAAQEFIYAGLDPNTLKFTKVGCFDTGVRCGGFGHVSVAFKSRQKQSGATHMTG